MKMFSFRRKSLLFFMFSAFLAALLWGTAFSFKAKAGVTGIIAQFQQDNSTPINPSIDLPPTRLESIALQKLIKEQYTSCTAFLSDLNLQSPLVEVTVQHMTNYRADRGFPWWGGYTKTRLFKSPNGHIVGSGSRLISDRRVAVIGAGTDIFGELIADQPFSIKRPDPMSYDIDPKRGKITFQGQYGPYDMICVGNKFAVVNTGDSLETFSFSKITGPR
jgi:hypothetical protein